MSVRVVSWPVGVVSWSVGVVTGSDFFPPNDIHTQYRHIHTQYTHRRRRYNSYLFVWDIIAMSFGEKQFADGYGGGVVPCKFAMLSCVLLNKIKKTNERTKKGPQKAYVQTKIRPQLTNQVQRTSLQLRRPTYNSDRQTHNSN